MGPEPEPEQAAAADTRELVGIALFQSLKTQKREQPGNTPLALTSGQTEPSVVPGAEVGKQGIVLKHHADPSPLGHQPGPLASHQLLSQLQRATLRPFKTCDQTQQRCFSAARGTEQTHQLSGSHLEIDATQSPGVIRVAVAMPDIVQRNR